MVHLNGCLFTSYGICGDILTPMRHCSSSPLSRLRKCVLSATGWSGLAYDENHEVSK